MSKKLSNLKLRISIARWLVRISFLLTVLGITFIFIFIAERNARMLYVSLSIVILSLIIILIARYIIQKVQDDIGSLKD